MWAQARAHPKAPKGMPPPQLKMLLFHRCTQKRKDAAPKEARKARIRARTRVAMKARIKGRVMIGKVHRSRSRPFRLVLGWVFNLLLIVHFLLLACSCSRSPHLERSRGSTFSFVFLLYIHVTDSPSFDDYPCLAVLVVLALEPPSLPPGCCSFTQTTSSPLRWTSLPGG